MNPTCISRYLLQTFEGLCVVPAWGETNFFYNPGNQRPRGSYFCTIKEKDGDNDKASALNRGNTYRLNFGISKSTFLRLFETIPKRPLKGGVIEGSYDFTKIDTLCPHPVYGWMCWVAILNPSEESFHELKKLLLESYEKIRSTRSLS